MFLKSMAPVAPSQPLPGHFQAERATLELFPKETNFRSDSMVCVAEGPCGHFCNDSVNLLFHLSRGRALPEGLGDRLGRCRGFTLGLKMLKVKDANHTI